MNQKADHPHQAAVHLMKAIRCCKDCYDVSEIQYAQLGELQYQKDLLARQLAQMGNPELDLERISGEVQDLKYLVLKVEQQNQIAYKTGIMQAEKYAKQRQLMQAEQNQGIHMELTAERERFRVLSSQIQKYMERVRYLHRINEQLVNRFCQY